MSQFLGSCFILNLGQGWAVNLDRGHFEKAALGGGLYLSMEIEASLG